MINITINRDYKKNIVSFSVKGHAYADEYGRDIVCASISMLTQTIVLALHDVAGIDVTYEMDDGFLYCEIPDNIDVTSREKANIIFDTMLIGIKGTIGMYSDYIKLQDEEV
ncbi:ribosomal-processing cysteine protease Prp [Wukongibacter sp. M2B1]|uniref:ribosomal-processing cysteine protease Prp n=1 Tax=Wukongibacter sp. M2B1 TaxID=3088895 RepID=UPI003D7AA8AE